MRASSTNVWQATKKETQNWLFLSFSSAPDAASIRRQKNTSGVLLLTCWVTAKVSTPGLRSRMHKIWRKWWGKGWGINFPHSLTSFRLRGIFSSEPQSPLSCYLKPPPSLRHKRCAAVLRPSPVGLRAALSASSSSPLLPLVSKSSLGALRIRPGLWLLFLIPCSYWLVTCAWLLSCLMIG